jgi:GDP-L-fucose synthase
MFLSIIKTFKNSMNKFNKNIFVAGHNGMVGSAIVRLLHKQGYQNVLMRSSTELDLTNQAAVEKFFFENKIDQVYCAAAKVGGIYANNTFPAEFIYSNLLIEANLIHQAWNAGVKELLFLGSSCIYPKDAPQPIKEEHLLTGKLEPTNEPYAIAKIAGIKMCESYNRQFGTLYRTVMPTNLYGPGDNYHPQNSHVLPALLQRFHEAKLQNLPSVTIWGTGKPYREFLYVDDLAEACVHLMNLPNEVFEGKVSPMNSHINIGTGLDNTIAELAELIAMTVGYQGQILFDTSKPDGTLRKVLDVSLIRALGWKPTIVLADGLKKTYQSYLRGIKA